MKRYVLTALALCLCFILGSCDYDNFDEPQTKFTGRIMYNGEQLAFGYNETYVELWEEGWTKVGSIQVPINIDGTFSQVIFDGTYKMVLPKGQGPYIYKNPNDPGNDTVRMEIKGDKVLDIEVTPYYMIRDVKYEYNAAEDKLAATCRVEQIITDPEIAQGVEYMRLFVGKTAFLYQGSQINWHTLNTQNNPGGSLDNVVFSGPAVVIDKLPADQDYVFARIAVKANNVEDVIMSPVQKVKIR